MENSEQRIKDVSDFVSYLNSKKIENMLQIFSTLWGEFPDFYPEMEFHTSDIDEKEFYLQEMTILKVF